MAIHKNKVEGEWLWGEHKLPRVSSYSYLGIAALAPVVQRYFRMNLWLSAIRNTPWAFQTHIKCRQCPFLKGF